MTTSLAQRLWPQLPSSSVLRGYNQESARTLARLGRRALLIATVFGLTTLALKMSKLQGWSEAGRLLGQGLWLALEHLSRLEVFLVGHGVHLAAMAIVAGLWVAAEVRCTNALAELLERPGLSAADAPLAQALCDAPQHLGSRVVATIVGFLALSALALPSKVDHNASPDVEMTLLTLLVTGLCLGALPWLVRRLLSSRAQELTQGEFDERYALFARIQARIAPCEAQAPTLEPSPSDDAPVA